MSRSSKKGPFINDSLKSKIDKMNLTRDKKVIRTWARASVIYPDMVGHTIAVHDGHKHVPVFISENMVGHRLGEFAPTRLFRGHGRAEAAAAATAATTGPAPAASAGAPERATTVKAGA